MGSAACCAATLGFQTVTCSCAGPEGGAQRGQAQTLAGSIEGGAVRGVGGGFQRLQAVYPRSVGQRRVARPDAESIQRLSM